jgi:hypothetical protein
VTAVTFAALLLLLAALLTLLHACGVKARRSLGWLGVTIAFIALAVPAIALAFK